MLFAGFRDQLWAAAMASPTTLAKEPPRLLSLRETIPAIANPFA